LTLAMKLKNKILWQKLLHFSNTVSQLPFHQWQYSSSISVWSLHFTTRTLFKTCAQYNDLLDKAQLLTQKLLKQCYIALRLKSSLQNLHGRHHGLLYLYIISISQMTINYFSIFRIVYYFRYHRQDFVYGLSVWLWITRWVSYTNRNCVHFADTWVHSLVIIFLILFFG
jgi:hypothetical protein